MSSGEFSDVPQRVEIVSVSEGDASSDTSESVVDPEGSASLSTLHPNQNSTVTVLVTEAPKASSGTIVAEGLEYEIRADGVSVALVGTAFAVATDIAVPSVICSGDDEYVVTMIGNDGRPTDGSARKGVFGDAPISSIYLPATVSEIAEGAFSGCSSLVRIDVSPDNPTYSSFEGMLFSKDLTRLLSVPEGKEGVALIPDQAQTVPASAFSRCGGLSFIQVGMGCAAFSSEHGILFSKDMKTLIACPPSIGRTACVPETVEHVAPGAFSGCQDLVSLVVLGRVLDIDATSFEDQVRANAVIALPAGSDYEERSSMWKAAGFTRFAVQAEPGDSASPKDDAGSSASGLAFRLLDDRTLEASWQGEDDPSGDLSIPASAELEGITYQVTALAEDAFAGRSGFSSATVPASVTTIGERAFAECADLQSIELPEGLRAIGSSAFEGSGLSALTIPASVEAVGSRAFADCALLGRVVALGRPEVASDVLASCANVSLYCPHEDDAAYPWNVGLPASGNHLMPYGAVLSPEALELEVGEDADLFAEGSLEAPSEVEASFSYAAKSLSVSQDGLVSGKAPGSSDVTVVLSLDGSEIARSARSVEVSSESAPAALGAELLSGDLPTTGGATDHDAWWSFDEATGTLTIGTRDKSAIIDSLWSTGDTTPTEGHWSGLREKVKRVVMEPGIQAQDARNWFHGMEQLVDVSEAYVPIGTRDASQMFMRCTSLAELPEGFTLPESVVYTWGMFRKCTSLVSLPAGFTIPQKALTTDGMFDACYALVSLPEGFSMPKGIRNMRTMFQKCISLVSLPTGFTLGHCEKTVDMSQAFFGCSSLSALPEGFRLPPNLGSSHPSCPQGVENAFGGCDRLTVLPTSFDFPPEAVNAIKDNPDYNTWFSTSRQTILYYAGKNRSVLEYDWTSQNRVLVTPNDPAHPLPEGSALVSFVIPASTGSGWDPYTTLLSDGTTSMVADPGDPKRFGYPFEGWYWDETFTRKVDFTRDIVSDDMTVYGKFGEPLLRCVVPLDAGLEVDASGAVSSAALEFASNTALPTEVAGVRSALGEGAAKLFPDAAQRSNVRVRLAAGDGDVGFKLDGGRAALALDMAASTGFADAQIVNGSLTLDLGGAQLNYHEEAVGDVARLVWTVSIVR